jgi:hypothetical protein
MFDDFLQRNFSSTTAPRAFSANVTRARPRARRHLVREKPTSSDLREAARSQTGTRISRGLGRMSDPRKLLILNGKVPLLFQNRYQLNVYLRLNSRL